MTEALELSPQETELCLNRSPKPLMIDVREPDEFAVTRIDGARLIPMQEIPKELQTLEALSDERDLIFICHHGVRSLQVVAWLRARGVENCFSMAGGIDRWSREINPEMPRY